MNKRKITSHSTATAYKVEARIKQDMEVNPDIAMPPRPIQIGAHQWLTPYWQEVVFETSLHPAGIPLDEHFIPFNQRRGFLSYQGALALAWTLIAQLGHSAFYVECRLVQHKVECEVFEEKIGVVDMPPIREDSYHEVKVVNEETAADKTDEEGKHES